jgi:hypothetical protein
MSDEQDSNSGWDHSRWEDAGPDKTGPDKAGWDKSAWAEASRESQEQDTAGTRPAGAAEPSGGAGAGPGGGSSSAGGGGGSAGGASGSGGGARGASGSGGGAGDPGGGAGSGPGPRKSVRPSQDRRPSRPRQPAPGAEMLSDFQRWLLRSSAKSMRKEITGQVRRTFGGGRADRADVWDTVTNEIPPEVGESPECQWCPICRAARRMRESSPGLGDHLSTAGDMVSSAVSEALKSVDTVLSRTTGTGGKAAPPDRWAPDRQGWDAARDNWAAAHGAPVAEPRPDDQAAAGGHEHPVAGDGHEDPVAEVGPEDPVAGVRPEDSSAGNGHEDPVAQAGPEDPAAQGGAEDQPARGEHEDGGQQTEGPDEPDNRS